MGAARAAENRSETGRGVAAPADAAPEFPVREYIGAMSLELAQMARWDGDEALGRLLDSAAALAGEPLKRPVVELATGERARPS